MPIRKLMTGTATFLALLTVAGCETSDTQIDGTSVAAQSVQTAQNSDQTEITETLDVVGRGQEDGGIGDINTLVQQCRMVTPGVTHIDEIVSEYGQPQSWNVRGGAPDFAVWRTSDGRYEAVARFDGLGIVDSIAGKERRGGFVFVNRPDVAPEGRCIFQP